MRHAQLLAGDRRQAALVGACSVRELLLAGRDAEVCRGASHVVYVTLEVGIVAHGLCFCENRFVAARLDDTSLVEVQRAERAVAHAATVADQAELYFRESGDASHRIVARMPGSLERQRVDRIHLFRGQGFGRRVLHDEHAMRVFFDKCVRRERVEVLVLHGEAAGIVQLVGLHALKRWQNDGIVGPIRITRAPDRAGDECEVLDGESCCERIGDGHNGLLAHAVRDEVGARVDECRTFQLVRPVIVMCEPPQAGFDAAQDDGCLLVGAAD